MNRSVKLVSALSALLLSTALMAAPSNRELAQSQSQMQAQIDAIKQQLNRAGNVSPDVMMDVLQRLEQIQKTSAEVIGKVDQQQRDIERLRDRQRAMYADLDERMNQLMQANQLDQASDMNDKPATTTLPLSTAAGLASSQVVNPPVLSPAMNDTVSVTTETDLSQNPNTPEARQLYESAFNALRKGQHAAAIKQFDVYLSKYPKGRYAGNSQYWKAEAFYVTRQFKQAKQHFNRLIEQYGSSNKLADAHLKLGYTEYELKDYKSARKMLSKTTRKFPNSKVSELAQKRLLRMNKEKL